MKPRRLVVVCVVPLALVLSAASARADAADEALKLSDMDADEKALFEKVTGGELCPCGAAMSLAKCLQREDVCDRAIGLARVASDRIRKGLTYGEVVDAMIRHLDRISKPKDLDISDRPTKGPADAPVKIVEFSDFQCPHCSRVRPALHAVLAKFPGKVAVVFKHFPLPFHEHAANAAAASEIARKRGKFWEFHDLLFDNQANLSQPVIEGFLKKIGVPPEKISQAEWEVAKARVVADATEGGKVGVGATPTLFLNGIEIPGEDYTPKALETHIREALQTLSK